MSGNILTPVTLWKDFNIESVPECEIVSVSQDEHIRVTNCFVQGRKVREEYVKIYTVITQDVRLEKAPCVLLVRDFTDGYDEKLVTDMVNKGFTVVSIDLSGRTDGAERYTEYPLEIEYTNYQVAKSELYTVEGDVRKTCWYEWGCAVRYVLAYLKSRKDISKIGGFGIAESATVLWQVAAMDETMSCVAFALNSGWIGYRGIHKFGGQVEPQFSDDMYKFIAGVEPQAYAMHVKCPVLMLSATNSDKYDCDRAYDTVSRIEKDVYKAVHYSVGYIDRISGEAYNDLIIFFNAFLKGSTKKKVVMPSEPDIKADFADGKMIITVTPDTKDLKEVALYVSEETTSPSARCWFRVSDCERKTEDGYVFEYAPYHGSGIVTFFAKAYYKNGFVIGTNVIAKKFKEEEIFKGYRSNIVYSSRTEEGESIFSAAHQAEDNPYHVNISDEKRIKVLKGPMDISGVYCKWGLLTFKINAGKDKPKQDAMFMFDVYSKEDNEVTVKLITDYYGKKTEYMSKVKILGGDVWHNVKIEKTKFKTAEGMGLKSYDMVNAIEFDASGEWLINNALWV